MPIADRHFFVTKELKGERTVTRVKVLEGDDRIAEIARMLGGGKAAEEHAREMVKIGRFVNYLTLLEKSKWF